MADPETLIDTCCLLNLCAVDEPHIILPQIALSWYLARSVEREEISIRPHPLAGRNERRRVDLTRCVTTCILRRCEPESTEEQELYIKLAAEVDDGEAMPLAIACVRKWGVATDDAAARRVAERLGVVTLSTPELLRLWAGRVDAELETVAEAIRRIETLARFVPGTSLPGAEWWMKHRAASTPGGSAG
jgi:hypothetical protein